MKLQEFFDNFPHLTREQKVQVIEYLAFLRMRDTLRLIDKLGLREQKGGPEAP